MRLSRNVTMFRKRWSGRLGPHVDRLTDRVSRSLSSAAMFGRVEHPISWDPAERSRRDGGFLLKVLCPSPTRCPECSSLTRMVSFLHSEESPESHD